MALAEREYGLTMGSGAHGFRDGRAGFPFETSHDEASGPNGGFMPATVVTRDGVQLSAEVRSPAGHDTHGTVIFVHGFCGNKGENGLFHALADYCSTLGFRSILYDWRGIAQSQGQFPATTLDDHAADFESVAHWTRTSFDNAKSVHAVGFSLGAAVVGLALRRQLGLTSIAYLSPAMRPRLSMWPRYNTGHIRRELKKRGVVQKPGSTVLLGQAILDSLRHTDLGERAFEVDVPLLVCHGTADARIDCSHSRKLVRQTTRVRDFEYKEFDGASHSFRPDERWWPELGSALTAWFTMASQQSRNGRALRRPQI